MMAPQVVGNIAANDQKSLEFAVSNSSLASAPTNALRILGWRTRNILSLLWEAADRAGEG